LIRTAARTRRAERARNLTAHQARDITARARPFAALVCSLGLLIGCTGPRVEPDAPAGVSLAGSWRLNRQASADPDSLITAIVDKEVKRMRRHTRPDDDDPDVLPPPVETGHGGPGGGAGRADNVEPPRGMFRPREGMAAYLRSQYTNALGPLLNGEGLVIEQASNRFALVREGSRRSFTPGGHSVIGVTDGVADQTSGWDGREYVIDVRPQVGPRVTERYGLGPGGQLIEKVSLSGDGLTRLEFTRVYDKGAPPVRVLPSS
jgi:hypothetical protein